MTEIDGAPSHSEAYLAKQQTLSDPCSVKKWRIIGPGIVKPAASVIEATYTISGSKLEGNT